MVAPRAERQGGGTMLWLTLNLTYCVHTLCTHMFYLSLKFYCIVFGEQGRIAELVVASNWSIQQYTCLMENIFWCNHNETHKYSKVDNRIGKVKK